MNYKTFVRQKNDCYFWACFKLPYVKATMAQNILQYFPHSKIMALSHSELPVQNLKINIFVQYFQ